FVGGDAGSPGGTGTLTAQGGTVTASLAVYGGGTVNVNGGTINCGSTPSDNIRNDGVINLTSGALNFGGRIYGAGIVHQTNGASSFAAQSNVQSGTVEVAGGTATGNGTLLVGTTDGNGTGNGALTVT